MGNILKIKRGAGIVTTIVHEGKPIYNTSSKVLYLGDSGAGNGGILGAGSSIASEDTYLASKEILGIAGTDTAGYIQLKKEVIMEIIIFRLNLHYLSIQIMF